MLQVAFSVSTGKPLWNYSVNKGTVLYLALEDNLGRLQKSLCKPLERRIQDRIKAAELAGLTEAPAVIYTDIDDNQAQIIVGETNLRQRSFTDMTHSERAFCLAEHYEALKKKRGRKSTDELQEINSNKFTNESDKNSANPHNNAKNSNSAQNVPNSFSR